MSKPEFDSYLLNEKKRRFLDAVRRSAEQLGASAPKVNFWETGCPQETKNEWAHIHLDTQVICVSEFRLRQMRYEDIEETATHEVTHLFEASHNTSFQHEKTNLKIKSWIPPGGITYIKGGSGDSFSHKRTNRIKIDKKHCNYHLCKKRGSTFQCHYCKYYFCLFHHKPKPPSVRDIAGATYQELEEWRKEDAHPCFQYAQEYEQKKKRELEEVTASMNNMDRGGHDNRRHLSYGYASHDQVEESQSKSESYSRASTNYKYNSNGESNKSDLFKWIFFITLILIALGLIYLAANTPQGSNIINGLSKQSDKPIQNLEQAIGIAKNCSKTLISGKCSDTPPFYCNNGKLEENPDECGCPFGQRVYEHACILKVYCQDGSMSPDCSQNKPYKCINGTLIEKSSECGCPEDYKLNGDSCKKIQRCSDGTVYDECSQTKPFYCINGVLAQKATQCGCPFGSEMRQIGDECVNLRTPDVSTLEQMIHEGINEQRSQNGLPPLTFDERLAGIARAHSQDMINRNFFAHVNPDGKDPTARGADVGYSCYKNYGSYYTTGIAENIFQDWTYGTIWYTNGIETNRDWKTPSDIEFDVVNGWMNSPGHRQNILTSTYNKEGIGVAVGSDGKVEVTEDFC